MSDRNNNRFRSISVKASITIFLCFLTFFANAKQLPRNQRQTISTGGLTNTGISFNSWNEGQNSIDPYYDYQPQQQQQQQQQKQTYNTPATNWNAGKDNSYYGDYQYGQGASSRGYYGGRGLSSYRPTRGYDGAGQTWRGFGAGKDSYEYGRPSSAYPPQRGIKSTYY